MSLPTDGGDGDGRTRLVLRGGPPAWATAAAVPVVALALIANRLGGDGMRQQVGEPLPPWVVALGTVVLAAIVTWRAATTRAELDGSTLRCRNLLVAFDVAWADVEELRVQRRAGLVVVDVRVRNLRRTHRLGAATRFGGAEADEVLRLLAAHPQAGPLLDDPGAGA